MILVDFEEPADDFIPSGQPSAGGLIDTPFFDRLGGRGKIYGFVATQHFRFS